MIGPRSARANISWSMGAKFVSMFVAIFSVPLLLNLLGTQKYGIWVTLTSLVAFISLLDLGVGNSIRNSVASMDETNRESVRSEFIGFSRLLAYVGLIATVCFIYFIPNLDITVENSFAAEILYLPILILLPLMLGASVLQGARATGLQAVLQASGSWAFFAFIGLLVWINYIPSIQTLAFAWSFFYLASIVLIFGLALKKLDLPFSKLFRLSIVTIPRGRLGIGIEFLVLQMSALMLYSIGNILIMEYLGPSEVARYDIVNKIFQVGLGLYSVVIGVMWPEITRAHAEQNEKSLRRIFRNLAVIAGFFSTAAITGAFLAPMIINYWTQNKIQVNSNEALAIAGLVTVQSIAYVGAVFMNAFEQIRLQIMLAVISIILMVPLSTYFMGLGIGIASVPIAAMLLTALPMIVCNIAALRLIRSVGKAKVFM